MEQKTLLTALGARIRMIRLTKNLTQNQLAEICNFEKSTMSKIESGQVNISYYTLFRLSLGLGVPMIELVNHDGIDVDREGNDGHDGMLRR
jgi:transcriptional regulator with XRE-family HTH domain